MKMKWSNLPTGLSLTVIPYNFNADPETIITISGNQLVENDTTGVYYINFGTQLNSYDIIRVLCPELNISGWIRTVDGDQEISPDAKFLSEISTDLEQVVEDTIKSTIGSLDITVRPETKIIGACSPPTTEMPKCGTRKVTPMPKVVNNTFTNRRCN